jgi:hypothetical protein
LPVWQHPPGDATAHSIGVGALGSALAAVNPRTDPSYDATTSQSPDTASPPSTGVPSWVRHSAMPVCRSSALSWPAVSAAHTMSPVMTGEDSKPASRAPR